jgi:hypothetical protein
MKQQTNEQFKYRRLKGKFFNHKATTLVECLSVMTTLGILLGVFHTIFVSNWSALEDRIALATLQEEADQTLVRLSRDCRQARQIDVTESEDLSSATILDPDNNIVAVYRMNSDGTFQVSQDGENFTTLSDHLEYENSDFSKQGKALAVHLMLADQVLRQKVKVNVATEIFPRN